MEHKERSQHAKQEREEERKREKEGADPGR
jgi:hypothetical protein